MSCSRRQCLKSLSALSLSATAPWLWATEPLLTGAFSDDYAPWSWGQGNEVRGLAPDLLSALLNDKLKLAVQHKGYPWKRAQLMVETGEADLTCTVATAARKIYSRSSALPMFSTSTRVFVSRHSPLLKTLSQVKSIAELLQIDARFLTYQGSGWLPEKLGINSERVIYAPALEQCLKTLAIGRADVMVQNRLVTENNISRLQLGAEIQPGLHDLEIIHYHVLLSRRSAVPNLIERIDEALPAFKASPAYQAILQRYAVHSA